MKKRPHISQEDRELFRTSVKGVVPLPANKTAILPTSKPAFPRQSITYTEEAIEICDLGHDNMLEAVHAEDSLYFMRSGLQAKVMQKLRRGEFPIAAELDLHGLTVIQAHQALHHFLNQAYHQGWRCVHIIHGKGGRTTQNIPILKNRVNFWLRQYAVVLAFCSAPPYSGGKGAVYVLLKKSS